MFVASMALRLDFIDANVELFIGTEDGDPAAVTVISCTASNICPIRSIAVSPKTADSNTAAVPVSILNSGAIFSTP